LSNVKNVESNINRTALKNSTLLILHVFEINSHLFDMHSMAKSIGIYMNSETTSRDIDV